MGAWEISKLPSLSPLTAAGILITTLAPIWYFYRIEMSHLFSRYSFDGKCNNLQKCVKMTSFFRQMKSFYPLNDGILRF